MSKTLVLGMWPATVRCTVHRKEWAKWYEELAGRPLAEEYADALGLSACAGGTFLVGVFDGTIKTLAHEMGHTAIDIMQHAGVKDFINDQEQFCYLLGHLISEVAPLIAKGK